MVKYVPVWSAELIGLNGTRLLVCFYLYGEIKIITSQTFLDNTYNMILCSEKEKKCFMSLAKYQLLSIFSIRKDTLIILPIEQKT